MPPNLIHVWRRNGFVYNLYTYKTVVNVYSCILPVTLAVGVRQNKNPSSIQHKFIDAQPVKRVLILDTTYTTLNMSIPNSFLCPISQQIMEDPYIDTDGNSYERSAIMEWLGTRQISPITRRPLYPGNLVPNRGLKTLIEEFRNNGSFSETAVEVETSTAVPLDRKPIMLFAIIDNSGSMGDGCSERVSENEEDDGFSRLDLVKHTMNTIITSLSQEDKICLIKFSNAAQVIAELTNLSPANKARLLEIMKALKPEYSTNIWDGLRTALDIIAELSIDIVNEYNIEIFLLTDGVPNINPPRPITETLQAYLTRKCSNKPLKLHTFGYGYHLISNTLYELSKIGHGCFGFIPDASMVGTVFINSLSNSLVETDLTLQNTIINNITNQFCILLHKILNEITITSQQIEELTHFISILQDQLNNLNINEPTNVRAIDFIESLLLDCQNSTNPNLGQIYKAIQVEFYTKWGKHYLYSVLSAFENQVCINFKDKAMQLFKSDRFKLEQERIEEVFVQLPAPVPSASNHQQYNGYYNPSHHTPQAYASLRTGTTSAPAPRAAVNMNNYFNAGGGCFTADSLILVSSNNTTSTTTSTTGCSVLRVGDIQPGMSVLTNAGASKVECVVKLKYNGPIYQGTGLLALS